MEEKEVVYAGFWYRVLASVIDFIFSQIAIIIIVLPLAFTLGLSMGDYALEDVEFAGEIMGSILGVIVQWLYFTISESSEWQGSPGKKLLGIKVTDLNGERIGFGRANGRYWGKIISTIILFIGFLMAAFTKKKQCLHDMMAGTLVLKG